MTNNARAIEKSDLKKKRRECLKMASEEKRPREKEAAQIIRTVKVVTVVTGQHLPLTPRAEEQ